MSDSIARIPLKRRDGTVRAFTVVDSEMHAELSRFPWYLENSGYARRNGPNINGRQCAIFMHRAITNAPNGVKVDHINGDRLDNRRSNLRLVSDANHARNAGVRKDSSTGVSGVSWFKANRKWQAHIRVNGKRIHLGFYEAFEDAVEARREAEQHYFGEYARKS